MVPAGGRPLQADFFTQPAKKHRASGPAEPVGPLTAASATLRSALAQVVRVLPLSRPATGGLAGIAIRCLAPGVYTPAPDRRRAGG